MNRVSLKDTIPVLLKKYDSEKGLFRKILRVNSRIIDGLQAIDVQNTNQVGAFVSSIKQDKDTDRSKLSWEIIKQLENCTKAESSVKRKDCTSKANSPIPIEEIAGKSALHEKVFFFHGKKHIENIYFAKKDDTMQIYDSRLMSLFMETPKMHTFTHTFEGSVFLYPTTKYNGRLMLEHESADNPFPYMQQANILVYWMYVARKLHEHCVTLNDGRHYQALTQGNGIGGVRALLEQFLLPQQYS